MLPSLFRDRRSALGAVTVTATLGFGGVAFADNLLADGDGLAPVGNNAMSFGTVPCNSSPSQNAVLAIVRAGSGGNVFKNGTTASITIHEITGTNKDELSARVSDNAIALPTNWESVANGTRTADTATASVAPRTTSAGSKSANIKFTATGTATDSTSIIRHDDMAVSWTVGTCEVADTTAPTASATAKKGATGSQSSYDGSWTNQDLAVTLDAQDERSGVQVRYTLDGSEPTATQGTQVAPGTVLPFSAEQNRTLKFVAVDAANNVSSPVGTQAIKIDKTDPNVGCGTAPTAWSGTDVSIACTASDGGSGLATGSPATFNLSTTVPNATETSNASTGDRVVSDNAGNSATAGPINGIKVDKKVPSYNCDAAPTNWSASDISVNCTAEDHGSGLNDASDATFSLATSVAAGTETRTAATGTKPLKDTVNNQSTAGPIGGLMVDKKAPTVTCDPASTFLRNQSPANVTATFTDGGSGPGSGTASAAANTSTVGSKTVSVSKADNVNNTGSALCAYRVGFEFVGFSSPLNNPAWINKLKAGQAVPFKWRLLDANGPVTDLGGATMAVSNLSCSTPTEGFDPIEELAAGSSGLQNLGDGYYQVNWKSLTTYAGSCRTVALNLGEGITRPAWFQFTK